MPLFEVNIQNRIIKGRSRPKRIKGTQGNWYTETLYYLADSEHEAKDFALEKIKNRRMLGIPINTKRFLRREIKIIDVRRLA